MAKLNVVDNLSKVLMECVGTDDTSLQHRLLARLATLLNWLEGGERWGITPEQIRRELEFSYACSPISRTDCEVYNISAPRWVFRSRVKEPGEDGYGAFSFINMKRRHLLSRILKTYAEGLPENMIQVLDPESKEPLADCGLEVPARIARGFRYLTSDVLQMYGEKPVEALDEQGQETLRRHLPFIFYNEVSGACGAAIVFMSAIIMSGAEHADSTPGIAEIYSLTSSDDHIEMGLLTTIQLQQTFDAIGLGLHACNVRTYNPALVRGKGPHARAGQGLSRDEQHRWLDCALSSYILSGFPVVLSLDINKMRRMEGTESNLQECVVALTETMRNTGDEAKQAECARELLKRLEPERYEAETPIYLSNFECGTWLVPDASDGEGRESNHYVLLVGRRTGELERDPDGGVYLLQDPLGSPYLQASLPQLYECRPKTMGSFQFLPVVPRQVKLPFCSEVKAVGVGGYKVGVLELAWHRWSARTTFPQFLASSTFRLVRKFDLRRFVHAHTEETPDGLENWFDELGTLEPNQFVWVHCLGDKIGIYNAETPNPGAMAEAGSDEETAAALDAIAREIFVAELSGAEFRDRPLDQPGPVERFDRKAPGPTRPAAEFPAAPPAKVSMISSFWAMEFRDAARIYRENGGTGYIDLYLFMAADFEEVLGPGAMLDNSVVSCVGNMEEPDRANAARQLAIHYGRILNENHLTITGFSTYIPELAHNLPTIRQWGARTMELVCRVAELLRPHYAPGHEPHVEFVVGSIAGRLLQEERNGATGLSLRTRKRGEVFLALTESLKTLADLLGTAGTRIPVLTAELEPGPLLALNTLEGINQFVDEVVDPCSASGLKLGLNDDVGHWRLAEIHPATTLPGLKHYVKSLHLSDLTNGHLQDLYLGAATHDVDYQAHTRLLPHLPRTIEMECARDDSWIRPSVALAGRV